MNEKYHQYYHLRNDKTLISQHVPTENEIHEFNLWKEKEINFNKKQTPVAIAVFSIMILVIMLLRNIF